MSKIIDSISSQMVNPVQRKPVHSMMDVKSMIEEQGSAMPGNVDPRMVLHRVEVKFGTSMYYLPVDAAAARENIVREFAEVIYGEFRERFNTMERAMYENDTELMRSTVRDMKREMFRD